MLKETRAAVAEKIKASLAPDWQVSEYMMANPSPPCVQIVAGPVTYHTTMDPGDASHTLTVQAFVAIGSDLGPQMLLDELMEASGPKSIRQAIESGDRTLGGLVDNVIVTESPTGYRQYIFDGRGPLLGAAWSVELIT